MKVKIGNKIFDSNDEPIMLVLSDMDKNNIANMSTTANKYCSFPDDYDVDTIKNFMEINQHPIFTPNLLSDISLEITENIGNGETIENISYVKINDTEWIIYFDLDCDRYGVYTDNKIIINGDIIKVDISDTPLEGGGFEHDLVEQLKKILKLK